MKHYLPYLLTIIVLILWWVSCDRNLPEISDNSIKNNSLKKEIATDLKKRDTAITKTAKQDSVRERIIIKWKEIRHDSLIPCEEKLVICDTVIIQDSALIWDLKEVVKLDSSIIVNYQKSSQIDSLTIVGLKKEVKRQKRQKRLLITLAAALGLIAIVK